MKPPVANRKKKPQVKRKPLVLDLGLYPVTVTFLWTPEAFQKALGDSVDDGYIAAGDFDGLCHLDLPQSGTVTIGVFKDDVGVLAHEVYHAVQGICEYLGLPVDFAGSEVGAYLTGYLITRAVEYMAV